MSRAQMPMTDHRSVTILLAINILPDSVERRM